MNNKYYIFSDESGSWANPQDKFYIRSWVKVKEDDYLKLVGLWGKMKYPKPTHNSLLKNSNNIVGELNKIESKYFFTFTKLDEFYKRKFNVRNVIMENVSAALLQLEDKLKSYMKTEIPKKTKDAVNYVLFLNIYESYHIENALRELCDSGEDYEVYFDKPQFTENDYIEIFNKLTEKSKVKAKPVISKKSSNNGEGLGISYADGLALLSIKIIQENANDEIIEFLKKNILLKSIAGNIGVMGFNKIFYPISRSYGDDNLRLEETNLINNMIQKLQ